MIDFTSEPIFNILISVGIIVLTWLIAFIVRRILRRTFKRNKERALFDPTNYNFIKNAIVGIIYFIGFAAAVHRIPELRQLTNSILASAGILAVAIGFASQHALSNIISGFFIVLFKPFRVGDRISIRANSLAGIVEEITLRHVIIKDYENRRIILPNSIISDEVIVNADFGDGMICKWVEISITIESDVSVAKNIMREVVSNHPLLVDNRSAEDIAAEKPIVTTRVIRIDEIGVRLRAWAWTRNQGDAFVLGCDTLEEIKAAFGKATIKIAQLPRIPLAK